MKHRSPRLWSAYAAILFFSLVLSFFGFTGSDHYPQVDVPEEFWGAYRAWFGPAEVEKSKTQPGMRIFTVKMEPQVRAKFYESLQQDATQAARGGVTAKVHLLREGESVEDAIKEAPERINLCITTYEYGGGRMLICLWPLSPEIGTDGWPELRPVYPELQISPEEEAALRVQEESAIESVRATYESNRARLTVLRVILIFGVPVLLVNGLQFMLLGIPRSVRQGLTWYASAAAGTCFVYFLFAAPIHPVFLAFGIFHVSWIALAVSGAFHAILALSRMLRNRLQW